MTNPPPQGAARISGHEVIQTVFFGHKGAAKTSCKHNTDIITSSVDVENLFSGLMSQVCIHLTNVSPILILFFSSAFGNISLLAAKFISWLLTLTFAAVG